MVNGGKCEMSEIVILYPPTEQPISWDLQSEFVKKKRNFSWESALESFRLGNYWIEPLTSSRMLREEARIMQHCVNFYDVLCHRGQARVFSVRDEAAYRLATVSLLWKDDYWHLEQMKGPANQEILFRQSDYEGEPLEDRLEQTELYYVGQEILQLYRTAWSRQFYRFIKAIGNPI